MSPVCFLKRELNSKKRRPYGWHFITRDYSPVVPVCKIPMKEGSGISFHEKLTVSICLLKVLCLAKEFPVYGELPFLNPLIRIFLPLNGFSTKWIFH